MVLLTNTTKWNKKKDLRLCHNCDSIACTQLGKERYWYCFRCAYDICADDIDDGEIDDTLQVCPEQLELQAEAFQ